MQIEHLLNPRPASKSAGYQGNGAFRNLVGFFLSHVPVAIGATVPMAGKFLDLETKPWMGAVEELVTTFLKYAAEYATCTSTCG